MTELELNKKKELLNYILSNNDKLNNKKFVEYELENLKNSEEPFYIINEIKNFLEQINKLISFCEEEHHFEFKFKINKLMMFTERIFNDDINNFNSFNNNIVELEDNYIKNTKLISETQNKDEKVELINENTKIINKLNDIEDKLLYKMEDFVEIDYQVAMNQLLIRYY